MQITNINKSVSITRIIFDNFLNPLLHYATNGYDNKNKTKTNKNNHKSR